MSENRAAKFFWHLQDIYQELKSCRFAFVVAINAQSCFWELSKGEKSYARAGHYAYRSLRRAISRSLGVSRSVCAVPFLNATSSDDKCLQIPEH